MPKDDETNPAVGQIDRIKSAKSDTLAAMRALARARREAGDEDGANRIVLQVTAITRENLRIENARRKALRTKSLGPAIGALRALADEAAQIRQQIVDIASALAAAAQFLDLIRRVIGVLP